jgi:hypothetical protein
MTPKETFCEVRLYVCAPIDDPGAPAIAGGLNIYVWGDDPDQFETWKAEMRESFDPGQSCWWREITALVPEDTLAALFEAAPIEARVSE